MEYLIFIAVAAWLLWLTWPVWILFAVCLLTLAAAERWQPQGAPPSRPQRIVEKTALGLTIGSGTILAAHAAVIVYDWWVA